MGHLISISYFKALVFFILISVCAQFVRSKVSLVFFYRVFVSRDYNFQGLRLPVPSSLCVPVWR